ncbi:hypothetical protein [Chloracidobacterium thermophilum]|nr:hypothetical protein [Chloracidobacterium thermophilum]QUV79963.1 hypothetical protein J8C08_14440 [Chloracidobacterium thermophilum]
MPPNIGIQPTASLASRRLMPVPLCRRTEMKISVLFLTVCVLFLLSGCADSEYQQRIADLESEYQQRIADLEIRLESIRSEFNDVKDALVDVQSALESLKSVVDDFRYENWQDNVPDVEDATSNLESALDNFEMAINDVDSEL